MNRELPSRQHSVFGKRSLGKRAVSGSEEPAEDIVQKLSNRLLPTAINIIGWMIPALRSYINSRSRKGYGAQRIRSELMQKGVDKELIQAAFEISEIDWSLLAKEVAQRKFSEILPVEWKEKGQRFMTIFSIVAFSRKIQSVFQ